MIRGIYTGASAMVAKINQMNVIANNLANVNTTSFKNDIMTFKALPEMIARRVNDDGIKVFPLGSIDTRPVVGRLGTGVESSEVFTQQTQGSLRATENPFDFALEGDGFFSVLTPNGERYTRDGAFNINPNNQLVTKEGHLILGENGPIIIKINNFNVDKLGNIFQDQSLQEPLERPVQINESGLQGETLIDRFKIVRFARDRYLKKEGASFYINSEASGPALNWKELPQRYGKELSMKVIQGFLETSNVNPVKEMVKMIEVQRSYEASQKTITSGDESLGQLLRLIVNI
jgi:flagellar basal-body rod protein FlgG